jgi:hypothetical protein
MFFTLFILGITINHLISDIGSRYIDDIFISYTWIFEEKLVCKRKFVISTQVTKKIEFAL